MTEATVIPCVMTRRFRLSITTKALLLSSPEVGSSRNRIFGLFMSSRPMLTRFFSPPLMPLRVASPTREFAILESPRDAIVASANSEISRSDVPEGDRSLPE
mmetsp:Transcript_13112/g.28322  ORF Transcript_13112/g.28322 Transcript_13112/m.28322 type:complete len:102 (+) Transcript_13112:284-589(+)